MRPAASLDNPADSEQFIEPGITVGVDDAAELLQMLLRMLAPRFRESRLLRSGE